MKTFDRNSFPVAMGVIAGIATCFAYSPATAATIEDLRARLSEAIAACQDGFEGTARQCEASCARALEKVAAATSLGSISLREKLHIGTCASILEKADTPHPAFVPIITYRKTGTLPEGPVAAFVPTNDTETAVETAPFQTLCGRADEEITSLLDGEWLMRQSEGEAIVGDLRLPSIAYPKGQEVSVTISGRERFTFHGNSYGMSTIAKMDDLFRDRKDMAQWFPQALGKAPLAQTSSCDVDWPLLRVYGKAQSGFDSEIDIRLIAYSSTCMVGVHSGINEQFNGDPMPSAVYGVLLYKGPDGCG